MNGELQIIYNEASAVDEKQIRDLLLDVEGDDSRFDLDSFVVAKEGDMVVGCTRIKKLPGDCLELASLAVLSEYRRKGIGSTLIKEILEKEQKRPIYLITSSDMINFYQNFGFMVTEPDLLVEGIKEEYCRIMNMPFVENMQVVVMAIGL
ncbi:MAG: GNAT family N-acetyltransferase [Candidatus Nealsonbacteria bacterium]|nr:GNAT family N-acetyltransferase [Candidatus Nealsonbacteria bacterium]